MFDLSAHPRRQSAVLSTRKLYIACHTAICILAKGETGRFALICPGWECLSLILGSLIQRLVGCHASSCTLCLVTGSLEVLAPTSPPAPQTQQSTFLPAAFGPSTLLLFQSRCMTLYAISWTGGAKVSKPAERGAEARTKGSCGVDLLAG